MSQSKATPLETCPCGSELDSTTCCNSIISGSLPATTASMLMRSRYTAYTQKNAAYLKQSWHPDTCPPVIEFEDNIKWLGLKIVRHEENNTNAVVEFIARYKINGRAYRLHEASRFVRYQGRWVYYDGKIKD